MTEAIFGTGLTTNVGLFVVCTLVIGVAGTYLTGVADDLADRTGLGEAVTGAILLGATTSLSGIVLSVTAAARVQPELAMSNALGGIAVQTLFLAVADMFYKHANLEHAGPSATNLAQSALLICLLGLLLVATFAPNITVLSVHPITPILFLAYGLGMRLVRTVNERPMWKPLRTYETRINETDVKSSSVSLIRLWAIFIGLALLLGITGFVVEGAASVVGNATGLSATAVGVLLTAVCTSLPELVTSIAAVRRGALQLAIGGIIGGNAFDCLFAGASDIAYRHGSIYHNISHATLLWIALSLLMTGVLLLGLVRREEKGMSNIGFESVILIAIYIFGGVVAIIS